MVDYCCFYYIILVNQIVKYRKRLLLYNPFNGERYAGPWQNEDSEKKEKESPKLDSEKKKNKLKNDQFNVSDTTSTFISVPLQQDEEIRTFSFYGEGCALFTSKRRLLVVHDLSQSKPFHEYIFPKTAISPNAELSQAVLTIVPDYENSVRKKKSKNDEKKKTEDFRYEEEEEDEEEESEEEEEEVEQMKVNGKKEIQSRKIIKAKTSNSS